jgi:hypothetical protein
MTGLDVAEPRRSPETPLILLWAVLTLAATACVIGRSEHDAVHDPVQKAARGEIGERSTLALNRQARLRRALAALQRAAKPGEELDLLRLDPVRISARVHDPAGRQRFLELDSALGVSSSLFGDTRSRAVPFSRVDVAAPERMLRAVRRRIRGGRLDYLVFSVSSIDATTGWTLFLADVLPAQKGWGADGHGRGIRPLG